MDHSQKEHYLSTLGTADLIVKINEQSNTLQNLLESDAQYRYDNSRYLAGYTDDCIEVKSIIATLLLEPPKGPEGKKATVNELETWVRTQRDTHPQLKEAITNQNKVTFQVETNRINIDMARKRFESLRGLMALRTAQIDFLVDR